MTISKQQQIEQHQGNILNLLGIDQSQTASGSTEVTIQHFQQLAEYYASNMEPLNTLFAARVKDPSSVHNRVKLWNIFFKDVMQLRKRRLGSRGNARHAAYFIQRYDTPL